MEETGVVKEINGLKAIVEVSKQGTCGTCPGGSLCTTFDSGEAIMEAYNHAEARVGDTVKICFHASTYLKGTMLVYGLPSLMLIIGAIAGKAYLYRFFPSAGPDVVAACSGFGSLLLSFTAIKLGLRRFEIKKEYMPIIEEIINRG